MYSWLAGFWNSKVFKFLYQNHEGHHVLGGLANYNVCCPGKTLFLYLSLSPSFLIFLSHLYLGTDHLVGSYVPERLWRSKMKPVAASRETNKPVNAELATPSIVL